MKDILFPHEEMRNIQHALVLEVQRTIDKGGNMVVHAPTGLGKTAATLPIALSRALKKGLTVFFLTSRHTQHQIAIDTLKKVKEKYDIEIVTSDIIGKQWMCMQPGVQVLYSGDFGEYCRKLKEEDKCLYFTKTLKKNQPTTKAKYVCGKMAERSPLHTEELIEMSKENDLCPYEMSALLGKKAKVIVADYYYIFNETIRNAFLNKTGKELEDCVIIVDEAHNLPSRVRELNTYRLTTVVIKRAVNEAKKFGFEEMAGQLQYLEIVLERLKEKITEGDDVLVSKNEFIDVVKKECDYEQLIGDLETMAEEVREKQKSSSVGSIAQFLLKWKGDDEGFTRILRKVFVKNKPALQLIYNCMDPSISTKDVIERAHSTIMMSGTLTPAEMYKDVVGMPSDAIIREYKSPFPTKNKLMMVVPETTTKFTKRSEEQFKRIGEVTADIVNRIPGNSAIFFPSYFLMETVERYFQPLCKKTVFSEKTGLSKEDKVGMLENFKGYSKTGAVLLAVASGSFGEGVDLPGDFLKGVVIVGLPLSKPDLETQKLIEYYDKKFKKGWDYGYLIPAMNKCLQSAGRCIRSETDRGVVVFLDERFAWPNYSRLLPRDEFIVTKDYIKEIDEFFSE